MCTTHGPQAHKVKSNSILIIWLKLNLNKAMIRLWYDEEITSRAMKSGVQILKPILG